MTPRRHHYGAVVAPLPSWPPTWHSAHSLHPRLAAPRPQDDVLVLDRARSSVDYLARCCDWLRLVVLRVTATLPRVLTLVDGMDGHTRTPGYPSWSTWSITKTRSVVVVLELHIYSRVDSMVVVVGRADGQVRSAGTLSVVVVVWCGRGGDGVVRTPR